MAFVGRLFREHSKLLVPVVLALCPLFFTDQCQAYDKDDFQIWNTNAEDIVIGKDTRFTMEQEFRYGENASEPFYQHYDWGFAWLFDKRFELGLGYRLIFEKFRRKWREEDDYYTNLIWRQDIWKFRFEDRNRIEYRHWRYIPDDVRYRNRFALKYPLEWKGIKLVPYTSDEIFINSNGRGYTQNRFQSGFEIGLNRYFKADISYMLQSMRLTGDKWTRAHVLWMKAKVAY